MKKDDKMRCDSRYSDWTRGWKIQDSNPGRVKRFFLRNTQTGCVSHPVSDSTFPVAKRPRHDVNHSFPSSAEVKNE